MKIDPEKLRRIVVEELNADALRESVLPDFTSKVPLIPPPSPGSPEELMDLYAVMEQYQNNVVPKHLHDKCDEDIVQVFQIVLGSVEVSINYSYYNKVTKDIKKPIKKLKKYFSRPRPKDVAASLGIEFQFDDLVSATSYSYPSGHSVQAYVVAHMLAELHPDHDDIIYAAAELVSQSRVDRGVHFQSDLDYARIVAEYIYKNIEKVLEGHEDE